MSPPDERSRPRRGGPHAEVLAKTDVTDMVTHAGDAGTVLALSDERDLHLRLRLAAWRDGYAVAMAELDEARLEAFSDGWDQAMKAAAERRWAA